jgi:hypothetical protein
MIKKEIKKVKIKTTMDPIKNNFNYLFAFPIILGNLDINVSNSDPEITQIIYGIFLLSSVALFCFLNIIGYVLAYYLVQKGNYEVKYPKLVKLINYFKKVTIVYFTIEVILCFISLTLIVLFSFLFILK